MKQFLSLSFMVLLLLTLPGCFCKKECNSSTKKSQQKREKKQNQKQSKYKKKQDYEDTYVETEEYNQEPIMYEDDVYTTPATNEEEMLEVME